MKRWSRIASGVTVLLGVVATIASSQPLELISPNQEAGGYLGRSVSGVPDLNGDGRGDVVVGAHRENPGASPNNAGRAYIFSGSDGTALRTLASPNEEAGGLFGFSVSGIPDVDGDGQGDVVIGAHYEDTIPSATDAGRAYIFSGSDGTVLSTLVSPNEEYAGYFGYAVSGIDDVNLDGRGDVVVGAYYEDPGASPAGAGRAYIFSGSDGTVLRTLVSPNEESQGRFGISVSGIPDVDGDGQGDVAVGAYNEDPGASPGGAGRAYIFSGSGGTLLSTLVSPNEETSGYFGISVSGIPDVDGDGRGDIIVGAYYEDAVPGATDAGRAYIFSGSDGTLLSTLTSPNPEISALFGLSVSGVPDRDGDGRGDVIVGARQEDPVPGATDAGRAYVFSGFDGALLETLVSPNPEILGNFGISVSSVPDVNEDGRGDVAVGAYWEDPGASPADAGRAYVFASTTPEITVTGGALDFGDQDIDDGSTASQSITIANNGGDDLNFTGAGIQITGGGATEFIIVGATDTSPLVPGATRTVDVAFDPSSTGVKSATLAITTDDSDEPTVNISLSGTGIDQEIDIAVPGGSLDFVQTGPGPTAPQTVSIANIGTATLSFAGAGVVINGTDASDFVIGASDISPIPAGTTRTVEIVFDPAVLDGLLRSASLAITTDDTDEPTVNVPLTGSAYLSVEDWMRY